VRRSHIALPQGAAVLALIALGQQAKAEDTTRKSESYASQKAKPTTAKLVTMTTLYSASALSLVASGVFGWKSLARRNEADTEAQLAAPGFCAGLVAPECQTYSNLRELQGVYALRAWGLLGVSSVFALSGLAVHELWPNERYSVTAAVIPDPSQAQVWLRLQLEL